MKPLAVASSAILLLAFSAITGAQESLIGKYAGSFVGQNDHSVGVELVIASVENGVVKGTATRFQKGKRQTCNGDYPMEGELNAGTLKMKSTEKAGTTQECSFKLTVKQDGNKLVGTTIRDAPIELSK